MHNTWDWRDRYKEEQRQQEEARRQCAARIKHLRETINKHGFYAALRQIAEGGDNIKREAQMRILGKVEAMVQNALRSAQRDGYVKRKPRYPRLAKLNALMRDPAATAGERMAAQAAAERLAK